MSQLSACFYSILNARLRSWRIYVYVADDCLRFWRCVFPCWPNVAAPGARPFKFLMNVSVLGAVYFHVNRMPQLLAHFRLCF